MEKVRPGQTAVAAHQAVEAHLAVEALADVTEGAATMISVAAGATRTG